MKLSSSITTITPLSKFLALFLFLFLTVTGFYAGIQYEKALSPDTGMDPRLRIFKTKEECEQFTDRKCLAMLCEAEPTHESCRANNQKGWFATRRPLVLEDTKQ